MKIKVAKTYISGVKKVRILFLGTMLVILSFILLGSGLFLIHTAIFTFSMWSYQEKFIAALVLGGVEFLAAVMILLYLTREETWVKFSGIRKMLYSAIEGKLDNK